MNTLTTSSRTTWLCASLLTFTLISSAGACFADDYSQRPEAKPIIDRLVADGFERQWVTAQLDQASRQDSILNAMARPAEKKLTWGEYRTRFITQKRINAALAFWQANSDSFQRAEQTYGVPAPIILGILGVETFYGRNMGSYRVLDALSTLGFDYPPRSKFFLGELEQFFLLSRDAKLPLATTKGSYAGAIGLAQFMPSSYRAYAVDFDHDGKIDLIHSPADAIGSIANYFVQHGWQKGLPVAALARVNGSTWQSLFAKADLKPGMTLASAGKQGIAALACQGNHVPTPYCFDALPDTTPVAPLQLEGTYGTEYWLTSNNFYAITRYNHSPLYAMTVYQLAVRIAAARAESVPSNAVPEKSVTGKSAP